MEKKFKNKVAFTGPIPLRKAMVEELLKIGYKSAIPFEDEIYAYPYTVNKWNGERDYLAHCQYEHTSVRDSKKYQLPEQWDECLKAASEVEEEFVLPKKWCVKVTDENVSTLDIWRKQQSKHNKNSVPLDGYLVNDPWSDKSYCSYTVNLPKVDKDYTEITFEQFKKYVLKQDNTMNKLEDFTIEGSIPLKKAFVEEGNFKVLTSCTFTYACLTPTSTKDSLCGQRSHNSIHFILPQEWNEAMEYVKKYFNQTTTKEYDLGNGYKAIVDDKNITIANKGSVSIEQFIEWVDNNWSIEECDNLVGWKVKAHCKVDIGCVKGISGDVISQIYEDLTSK